MNESEENINASKINEGKAEILTFGNVFYNPVQQFNRDLSITVLSIFAEEFIIDNKKTIKSETNENDVTISIENEAKEKLVAGTKYDNGITILEALSATGLRSIRYAKEVPGVKKIIANDWSFKAAESITKNIEYNKVESLVEVSHNDATALMHQYKKQSSRFSAVDLDPYGCPSTFLDSAVQCVADGGLLLVTATDMAVLAGNGPETCYSKYGAVSLKMKCCHEMAVRILLQCIESHANRYGRYTEPLLSISADFYIRVFVRIRTSPAKCKQTTSKLSTVYQCIGCESFVLHPLGVLRPTAANPKQIKYGLPIGVPVPQTCKHCSGKHKIAGPIWSAPIHDLSFVSKVLNNVPEHLVTWKRIHGVLSVISEELGDVPLYYTLDRLCGILHIGTPPMMSVRSAILNAGFRVSFSHANKTSIKTDMDNERLWDIFRDWARKNPVKRKLPDDSVGSVILSQKSLIEVDWSFHPLANPQSRKSGFVRFQENPAAYWGPGTRGTAMVGEEKISKSVKNQGKYSKRKKRGRSNESLQNEKQSKCKTDDVLV